MATPEWAPLSRHYETEKNKYVVKAAPVTNHPLLPNRPKEVVQVKSKNANADETPAAQLDPLSNPLSDPLSFVDPLSSPSPQIVDPLLNSISVVIDDPLSNPSVVTAKSQENKMQSIAASKQAALDIQEGNRNTSWDLKKQQILRDFTFTGNVTLASSAFNEFSGSGVEDGSATRYLDKYTERLASLERKDSSQDETVEMSQKEYQAHINRLSGDLSRAWANDERVGSLKIAIQLAKLLADTTVPLFYPSIFVSVTEALDKFGNMVYARLRGKAEEVLNAGATKPVELGEYFTSADVPPIAKETCRNWFYKTACIRELLPRIYIEISLFKCYRFLTETDFEPILSRLGSIIRGIGNPLVAVYARMYLVVVGNATVPHLTTHALSMLQDIIFSTPVLREPHMLSEWKKSSITAAQYFGLLSPAVEWIVKCVGRSASKEVFQSILQMYRDHSNDAMMLRHIIESFDASHYTNSALGMAALIKSCTPSSVSVVETYTALGKQLSIHPPPEEQRLQLLNEVWKIVAKSTDLLQYVKCSYAWLDLVQKFYSEREMFVLLQNLASRLVESSSTNSDARTEVPEPVLMQLENLISSLIGQSSTFGTAVLTSEDLLKILDAFKGPKKVSLCKDILESFKGQEKTNDAVLINTLFDLGRVVHDSVDQLSPIADISYIAELLRCFIDKIDFGRDLEQQLNFYVECRGAFCNLDQLKDKLIISVGNLSMKAFRIMKGKHSKKTATFVKACLAYAHITIPSLSDVFRKLELLLLCAQIALVNQCLPQTDTFLKAAISLIPEMPTHYDYDGKRIHFEERLSVYLRSLLSTLVVTPGHPEHGPFYIVQGLINAVPRYQWQPSTGVQTKVYTNMLALLCTFAQKKFPYHIQGVQSNDELYGGAETYMTELSEHINVCVGEVLKQLTAMGERNEASAKLSQARATMDLVNQIAAHLDLNTSVIAFLVKLVDLAGKQKGIFARYDAKYFSNTVEFVANRAIKSGISASSDTVVKLRDLVQPENPL